MVQLRRPSPGAITSKFGARTGGFHEGIDFGWGNGWNIYAAAAGTVVHAGPGGAHGVRYGNLTIIDHGGGVQTRYAHQSRIDVKVGQKVAAGQAIGVIGGSGARGANTYDPHLHFELLINGVRVDPMPHFTAPAGGNIIPIIDEEEDDDMRIIWTLNGPTGGTRQTAWFVGPNGILGIPNARMRGLLARVIADKEEKDNFLNGEIAEMAPYFAPPTANVTGAAIDYAELAKAVNDDAARRLAQ